MKLSDVSPLAAMVTGEGAMGKLISQGVGGMIPAAIAKSAREDSEQEARLARAKALQKEAEAGRTMKKGGKVTAKRRGDGIAQRGLTKGRMI